MEIDSQLLISPSMVDTAVPVTAKEQPLQPLDEASELKSEGEFTHQSDLSNIFQGQREQAEKADSESSFVSKSTPKPTSPITPSVSISDPESPPTPASPQGSIRDFFFERSGQRKESRVLTLKGRMQASSSSLLSMDHMIGSEMKEPSSALPRFKEPVSVLPRSKTTKSLAHSQYKSEPVTGVESVEDLRRVKFEEYMEERGTSLSPPIKELFETYMDGPTGSIGELNVAESGLVDSDLRDLCQLIEAIRWLEAINISSNSLQFLFFDSHADLYSRNITQVKSLDLSYNPLGKDGITSLFLHFLISHVNLEELHLQSCLITDRDFDRLASSLEYLRLLKRVDLRNNRITGRSIGRVVKLLKRCGELKKVMLNGQKFSRKAAVQLKQVEERVDFDLEIGCFCSLF